MAICCLTFIPASAQNFPKMDASPIDMSYYPSGVAHRFFAKNDKDKNAVPVIRIIYSRPQKKGRDIFGDLEKFGSIWRIGANESTEILFMKDVTIGGSPVKAGRYTVYALLGEQEWTLYISSDLDGWGAYAFDPAKSVIAQVVVPVESTSKTIENLSILFEEAEGGATMVIGWDHTIVRMPIGF